MIVCLMEGSVFRELPGFSTPHTETLFWPNKKGAKIRRGEATSTLLEGRGCLG